MHRIALQYFRGGIGVGNVGVLEGTKKNAHLQLSCRKIARRCIFLVAESHTGLHEYAAMLLKKE